LLMRKFIISQPADVSEEAEEDNEEGKIVFFFVISIQYVCRCTLRVRAPRGKKCRISL
jgi:hypothetical protein